MRVLVFVLVSAALASVTVPVRSRIQPFKGSNEWREVDLAVPFDPTRSAIVICDMWDRHWCRGATERVNAMVGRMEPLVQAARKAGVLIVHAPSNTMKFYEETAERRVAREVARAKPDLVREISDPPLPIDDSDGGCDTGEPNQKVWTRQHAGLTIAPGDVVSDDGEEIYSLLKLRQRSELFIMGVHTNMCILNRSFAIRQMTKWGLRCFLVRDLTDAMYDPKDRPYVTHEQGTELVIQHIEKYWAPTVLSKDLLAALRNR